MENRVLVLAPHGRDAQVAAELLTRHAMRAEVCGTLADLLAEIDRDVGAVLLAEEALAAGDARPLMEWVRDQPNWSDLPFVVLSNGSRLPRSEQATDRLERLGTVVLLERPLHADALVGAVRSALQSRRRQYEVRASAEALERAVVERTDDLRAARDSLQLALEAADLAEWDIDLATGQARRTMRHDAIFGYSELQPAWSVDLFLSHVDVEHRHRVAARFEDAMTTGVLDIDCPITTADGQARHIIARGRLRLDADGNAIGMAGVVGDVTDRRDADARLAQAQKMDAVGQLTGGVAHDFNNLLTPITGNLDLLRMRSQGDARAERLIGNALKAAERAATLTQRLLTFSRRQALEPTTVDVAALIDGMEEMIRRTIGAMVEVRVAVPDGLPSAVVDPNQLELALLNLAINGRDAMPGGGTLTISARREDVPVESGELTVGGYLVLCVADTGTGMDAATLAKATEPFFSTKGVGRGTGLGLSMIHGLAAQSNGALRLTSRPGEGTAAELWLPVSTEQAERRVVGRGEPERRQLSADVLLVDDEALVREATADLLRDLNYRVREAASGREALDAVVGGYAPDVIVTDYLMPQMTGGALIRAARESGCQAPALLVTGYSAAGADVPSDVTRLAKPFSQMDLARAIEAVLASTAG